MKLLNLSKLVLCSIAVSAVSALSIAQTWSAYANYNSGDRSVNQTNFIAADGSGYDAALFGVGAAGGVALVIDTTNNQYVIYVNGTGPVSGIPFSFSDSVASSPSDGRRLMIVNYLTVGSPGAYATSSVTQSW